MREHFLPFALPDLDESEFTEIQAALNSGWVTTGPKTRQFETEFAQAVGAQHAVAVNSCTAAMHLALEAIGIRRGDRVITTPYTFAATAEVIRYFDAVPVFVDVERESLNIDPERIRELLKLKENENGSIKAIIPVHIGGLAAKMDAINTLAIDYDLAVIEDAAHAFPSRYKEKMIGSVGTATCFSFYATKTITTGEGGMVCTDNPDLAERCRIMALHGISKDAWKRYTAEGTWYYEIVALGFKYNMTDVAAAMGLAQLRKAERMRNRRQDISWLYHYAFRELPELQIPYDRSDCQHAWHLYLLRLHPERLQIDRNQFIEELKARNIGTSVHFIPLHLHPYYRQNFGYQPDDFPVAYQEYQRVISLPIYSKMSDQDVQDVIEAVVEVVKKFRKNAL